MPDDQYNGIEIEVNVYERAGQWTGEYILTKRLEAYTLNEVNSLTEAGDQSQVFFPFAVNYFSLF